MDNLYAKATLGNGNEMPSLCWKNVGPLLLFESNELLHLGKGQWVPHTWLN